jgi:uncharacterized protein YegP (UPF0339 family)
MPYFSVFKDKKSEWRWTLKADNHEPIADSGEGYTTKQSCLHGIRLVKDEAAAAPVLDISTNPPLKIPDEAIK